MGVETPTVMTNYSSGQEALRLTFAFFILAACDCHDNTVSYYGTGANTANAMQVIIFTTSDLMKQCLYHWVDGSTL